MSGLSWTVLGFDARRVQSARDTDAGAAYRGGGQSPPWDPMPHARPCHNARVPARPRPRHHVCRLPPTTKHERHGPSRARSMRVDRPQRAAGGRKAHGSGGVGRRGVPSLDPLTARTCLLGWVVEKCRAARAASNSHPHSIVEQSIWPVLRGTLSCAAGAANWGLPPTSVHATSAKFSPPCMCTSEVGSVSALPMSR